MNISTISNEKKLDGNILLMQNVKYLMEQCKINEAELARKTNIPQPTLHKIITGRTEDPRTSTLVQLANFLKVSIDQLVNERINNSKILANHSNIQSIPIINWRMAIKEISYIESIDPNHWEEWVVTEFLAPHAFALVSKPSMEPRFPRGTILIIDPDLYPKDGDTIIVRYENTEEATIREISIDGPTKLLRPINHDSKEDILDENKKILGVLIQSRFTYLE